MLVTNNRFVAQAHGVDAVPHAVALRSVVKQVTEMSSASRARDSRTNHPVGRVPYVGDTGTFGGGGKGRPSRTRVELLLRGE